MLTHNSGFLKIGCLAKKQREKLFFFFFFYFKAMGQGTIDWNAPNLVFGVRLVKYNTMVLEVCTGNIFQIHFLYFRCNAVHFYLNNKKIIF